MEKAELAEINKTAEQLKAMVDKLANLGFVMGQLRDAVLSLNEILERDRRNGPQN
jgi:hypothetical protein